jgi:hypothetical protein
MKNVFKKVFIASLITLMMISLAVILIWQYLEYKRELNYYRIQERWHQSIYLNDKFEIKSKSIRDISVLIEDTEKEIDRISKTVPENGYYNFYKMMSNLEALFQSNQCLLYILAIETEHKDFYEELKFSCSLKGARKNIVKSLEALRTDGLIIRWGDACFQTENGGFQNRMILHFSSFLFVPAQPSRFRFNRSQPDPLEYREVRTWLPPLSIWIKRSQIKALELRKIQNDTPEFNIKVEMIEQLKDVRKQQRMMSTLIESLQEVTAGSDQVLTNIGSCL